MSSNEDLKDEQSNNIETPPPSPPQASSTGWSWSSFVDSASNLADKAQELAKSAGVVASEKASVLAQQASDIKITYDVETATNILMSTIGVII
jgi:hypothetical protein